MKRVFEIALAIVVLAATTAYADAMRFPPAAPISRLCPQEWHQLDTNFPGDTAYYKQKSVKFEWVKATAEAKRRHRRELLRHILAMIFVHDLNKSLGGLLEPENHTQEHFKRTQLQLDLMNCLKVPVEQHDGTIALYRHEAPAMDPDFIHHMLKLSEGPYCLKLDQAFLEYMTLNPTDDSRYLDYMNLLTDPADECLS